MARVKQAGVPSQQAVESKAPVAVKLLFLVVQPQKAEYYSDLLQAHTVNLIMQCQGRGTAPTQIAEMLGIADDDRAVLIGTLRGDKEQEILRLLEGRFKTIKNGKGIAFTVPMSSVIGATFYQFLCEV